MPRSSLVSASPWSQVQPRHLGCRRIGEKQCCYVVARKAFEQQQQQQSRLDRVQIVLVSPKHPENVGSVLRVGGNFCCGGVTLVDPRWDDEERWWGTVRRVACESPLVDWQHQEKEKEEAYASDGGGVRVVDTLREALRDTHGAFVYVGVCLSACLSIRTRITATILNVLSSGCGDDCMFVCLLLTFCFLVVVLL